MKAKKACKKLVSAIIGFVLSLALCLGVVIAWFSANDKVGAENSKVGIHKGDVVRFEVIAHYLDNATGGYEKAASGNVAGEGGLTTGAESVDANTLGVLEDGDFMRPYGGIGNTFATAVLFEIEYEIVPSDKHYRIYSSCPLDNYLTVEALDGTKQNFKSALSNAVGYYEAEVDGTVYSKAAGEAKSFVKSDNSKRSYVPIKNDIVPTSVSGNYVGKAYAIMDYIPERFVYLSSLMIQGGGALTSGLSFFGDLLINIEAYDPDNPKIPDELITVPVTGVALDKSTVNLGVGGTQTLTATISPTNATNTNVTWSSDDESVATVDSNGKITAKGIGTTNITVTTENGLKSATCVVNVNTTTVVVTGVALDITTANLSVGETQTLTATVSPSNATNQEVAWSSSDVNVARVENGVVTAVGAGTATITVKTADGDFTATCTVNVTVPTVAVTGVTLNKTTLSLEEGKSETLVATIAPSNATNKDLTWKSNKTSVATVDGSGKVTAVSAGTATITVTTADGDFTATCTVNVTEPTVSVTGVTLNKTTLSLEEGKSETLIATVEPTGATNKDVTWSSSKPDVATVDGSGKVTAVSAGTATITVTTADGGKTASCTVTVTAASGTGKFTWTDFVAQSIAAGSSVSDANNIITLSQETETRNSVSKTTEITELGITSSKYSVGKAFKLTAGEKDLTVTLYLCGTDSKGAAVKNVAITLSGATAITAGSSVTVSGSVANVSGTYGVLTVKIAKGTTCTFTPDSSNRIGIYAMVVEY